MAVVIPFSALFTIFALNTVIFLQFMGNMTPFGELAGLEDIL